MERFLSAGTAMEEDDEPDDECHAMIKIKTSHQRSPHVALVANL